MAWRNATKGEILDAVLRFYRQRLSLPTEAVYPVVRPMAPPRVPIGGDWFVTVAMGDGRFTLEEQDDEQLREDTDFTVTGYMRMQSDQASHDEQLLLDPARGGLFIQSQLLLLVGYQLKDTLGVGIAASRVYARTSHHPDYDSEQHIGWAGITFGVDFDWNLPEAGDLPDD